MMDTGYGAEPGAREGLDALYRHSEARHPRHCESRSDVAIHAFAGPQ